MLDFLKSLFTREFYPNNPIYKSEVYKTDVDKSQSDVDIYTIKAKVYKQGVMLSDNELIFRVPKVVGDTINTGSNIRTAIISGKEARAVRVGRNNVGINGEERSSFYFDRKKNYADLGKREDYSIIESEYYSVLKYLGLLNHYFPDMDIKTIKDLDQEQITAINEFRLSSDAVTKLRIYYKDRNIGNKLNRDTFMRLMDLMDDEEQFNDRSNMTPIDFRYIDVNTGLVEELKKKRMTFIQSIQGNITKLGKLYSNKIQNAIDKYFRMQSEEFKNIQVSQNSNALTIQSQSRKIYYYGGKDKNNEIIRMYNDNFIGVLDPIQTTESNMINKKNELTNATVIDNNGKIFIKVLNRKFEPEAIEYSEYITSKILTIDHVNYVNKSIHPDDYGKYIIFQYGEYDEIDDPEDIDYYFTPDALMSPSTSIIPFIQNTDTVRGMMSGKHSEQSIPISGAKPPIVYTKYSKMICDQSSMNINSGYDGEVVDILDNEYVKILTDQGKEKVYHVNEYFNSIDSTSNKYDLSVKVGDKIKKGQNIFMLNSFKGGEFCTVTPAYVAYTTLYSFEHEDGMILRQGFLKELAHPALEQIEIVLTADKKYYFDASQFEDLGPDAYDRFGLIKSGTVVHRKETLFRYYEELPQDDDYVRLSKAIIKDESPLRRVKNIEVPFFIHEGTVKRVRVFTNVEKSDNAEFINYYRKQLNSEESKIRDFSHDKRFTIENPRESSGDIQYTVVIEIEYMNLAKIADKLANEYGSKGVITRIIPDEYMLRDRDGTPMDIILSPLTVPSRKNTGQFYEIKLGLVGFRVYKMIEKYIAGDKSVKVEDITEIMNTIDRTDKYNKYSLEDWKARLEENKSLGYMRVNADPFDKYFTAPMVDRLLVLIGIPEGREKLFNPQSNRWTDVPILIGMSSFRRLHFIAEKRASATGKTDIMNVPALGYGKLRSDGQSISENIAA